MNSTLKTLSLIGLLSMITGLVAFEAGAEIVDRIAAVVNTTVITEFQVQQALRGLADDGASEDVLKRDAVLDFLIEQELALQEAARLGIIVTDDELKNALDTIKQQNNLASDEDLRAALAREGKILSDFQDEVRNQIRLAKVVGQEVRAKAHVSEAEVTAYYEAHREELALPAASGGVFVRQIVLAVPEDAAADQVEQRRIQAEALTAQLRAGANFADAAREFSQHSSAGAGGETGPFRPGELAAPFDVVFTLDAGEVTDPIRTDAGFLILSARPARAGEHADVARIKTQIRNVLLEEKSQQLYVEWIATLKNTTYIDLK